MKDISAKEITHRHAVAQAVLHMKPKTIILLRRGGAPKGDPLPVAKVAAIQGAKNTSQIIPYCHPMNLESVAVAFKIGKNNIVITVQVSALYKTGVEMEALTAAGIAALTLYDMLKGVDPGMEITDHRLLSKTGRTHDIDYRKHGRA